MDQNGPMLALEWSHNRAKLGQNGAKKVRSHEIDSRKVPE